MVGHMVILQHNKVGKGVGCGNCQAKDGRSCESVESGHVSLLPGKVTFEDGKRPVQLLDIFCAPAAIRMGLHHPPAESLLHGTEVAGQCIKAEDRKSVV